MQNRDEPPVSCAGAKQPVLSRLQDLTREVAAGRYERVDELFDITRGMDEEDQAAQLAESFGMMVVQVEAREFSLERTIAELKQTKKELEIARQRLADENIRLKTEVGRLRIEIDQKEKAEDVARITESDFFKDLQKKVREFKD